MMRQMWEEVRRADPALPEQPQRDVPYSLHAWWEMRKNSPEVQEAIRQREAWIEEGIRRCAQ